MTPRIFTGIRLRQAVSALLVVACAALGTAWPGWSFALYQLGYYSEAKQAEALAADWLGRVEQLRAVQRQCAQSGFTLCVLVAGAERALAQRMADGYRALADDPPDADFASVAVPEVGPVSTARIPEASGPFLGAWAVLFTNHARTAAVLEAFVTSNERRQGAALAQDAHWTGIQAQLTALYASELGDLAARQPALAQAAIAAWQREGLPAVQLDNGGAWPALIGGRGIAMRTREFASSMAALGAGGLVRVEFDIDADAADEKSLEGKRGDADDVVRITIAGESDFDAGNVDPRSVRFGPGLAAPIGGKARLAAAEDGRGRLVLRFSASEAGLDCRDDVATLVGSTLDGRAIGGFAYLAPEHCTNDAAR